MKKIIILMLLIISITSITACSEVDEEVTQEEVTQEEISEEEEEIPQEIVAQEGVIYVDVDATGNDDGSSWNNAYNSVQDALSMASAGNEIWIAEGTYYPTDDEDMDTYFLMIDDVDMYGGFDATENSVDERDWDSNETVLSGDIGEIGVKEDNVTKVVVASNATLDGFTITGGYMSSKMPGEMSESGEDSENMPPMEDEESGSSEAGHTTPDAVTDGDGTSSENGNGICIWGVAPTIINCTITENEGGKAGGVYINDTGELDEVPTFINTTISYNIASGRGGGVAIDAWSKAIFIDCIFDSNECTSGKGGAIYDDFGGTPYLENCLFINNYAQSGAAMGNDGVANPRISNCTFYNNEAAEVGGALYQGSGPYNDPAVINSIIWGNVCELDEANIYDWNECNTKIDYSIVEMGYIGEAILDEDPLFIDPTNGDFELQDDSPALTASSENGRIGFDVLLIGSRTDEDYETIIQNLYAMELSADPISIDITNPVDAEDASDVGSVVYVDIDAIGNEDGSSWNDAFTSLQEAINYANAAYELNGTEVDVRVAQGIYIVGEDRSDSIMLREGVNVYGGYVGDDRDYEANETIISGEIGDSNDMTDNVYHVLIGADNAVLDGFTVTGGYADGIDGEGYDNKGGGILNYLAGNRVRPDIEPTLGFDDEITNCTFSNNYAEEGGAVYTYHGGNPIYTNCSFVNNSAKYGGATLDRAGTNAIYTDCEFTENSSTYKGGAAFVDYGSMLTFTDCSFDTNTSKSAGGAIYAIDRASQAVPNETDFDKIDSSWSSMTDIYSAVLIEGCSFTNNTSEIYAGAIYLYDSSIGKITNSTFSKNESEKGAAITLVNSSTLYLDDATTFTDNSPEDTSVDDRSNIITD